MEERKLNRIKVVLAEKDKTGRWLSEQIGKSNCTVSKYINQKVQPDLKTLNQIADILQVDVKDLLVSTLLTCITSSQKSSFPTIADYVENLIALTSAQHMQEAHPNGNTQLMDKDFQYMCLVCKTESIRRNLQDGFGTPMFYSFENYMTVLDTGFSSSFFMGLEQDDYNSVLSGIEMNYK